MILKLIKILLSVGILMISNNIHSQEYKSILLDYSFNPNPSNIVIHRDSIVFTAIGRFVPEGGTMITSMEKNLNDHNDRFHPGWFTASGSLNVFNESLYIYGNDRIKTNQDLLFKQKNDKSLELLGEYTSDIDNNNGTYSVFIDSFMYQTWYDDHTNGIRSFGVRKVDTLGNQIWTQNYHFDEIYSTAWRLDVSKDSFLLVSNDILIPITQNLNNRYGQLKKIDQEGNLIWEFTTAHSLNIPTQWLANLSNNETVICHEIDRSQDLDFIINNLDRAPNQLSWINDKGELIREYIFKTFNKGVDIVGLKATENNSVFAYGTILEGDVEGNSGIIIKFDGAGKILWSNIYRDPSLANSNEEHVIKNLIELENGDLITLGRVNEIGQNGQIWLMRIDSEGCLSESNCGRPLTLATQDAVAVAPVDLFFPNPSEGIFMINKAYYTDIKELKVFNLQGALVYKYGDDIPSQLDLTNHTAGIYTIQLRNKEGAISVAKVVKH